MPTKNEQGGDLVILGSGGHAREIAWLVSHINRAGAIQWNLVGFWSSDAGEIGRRINGVEVIDPRRIHERSSPMFAVAAIGDPRVREKAVGEAARAGLSFATLVHPDVPLDEATVTVGPGSMICAGSVLTTNITIGAHVIVNIHCTISHDCVLEDFVTVSPGCHLCGHTTVRRSAYLGAGLVTAENHEIGRGAIVGAQAAVVSDIEPGVTAVGVPAKPKASA